MQQIMNTYLQLDLPFSLEHRLSSVSPQFRHEPSHAVSTEKTNTIKYYKISEH